MAAPGNAPAPSGRRTLVLAALVFTLAFTAYVASWQTQRTDSVFVMHTAMSLVSDGDFDISEFASVRDWQHDFFTVVDGATYMEYPAAVAVLAAPFVLLVNTVTGGRLAAELDAGAFSPLINATDMAIASFYTALAAAFIFLISRRLLNEHYALAAAFIFAFCTAAWSTASRGLWQQGPSMLLLAVALYLAMLAKERPGLIQYLGIPLAAAYTVRPTNAIPAALFTLFVFIEHRQRFLRYLGWSAGVVLLFLAANLACYGAPLAPYHLAGLGEMSFGAEALRALAGQLISPGRGLLVYSPIFLLAPYGLWLKRRDGHKDTLDWYLVGMIGAHWLTISLFIHWWGGQSYGPRLFASMLPLLVYFLLPVLARIQTAGITRQKALAATLSVLVLASFLINLRGATAGAPFEWNGTPLSIDEDPSRLWDWSDPAFLRGL